MTDDSLKDVVPDFNDSELKK